VNVQKDSFAELDIRVVVLVGGRDFGRCPLAARLPTALWPVSDKPALQRLLGHLAAEGLKRVVVCCGQDVAAQVQAACADAPIPVTFVVEELASGTAGCLRDAAASDPGDLLVVFSSSMMAPPPLSELVAAHLASGAEMTVVFNPSREHGSACGPPAEIYLCQPKILNHIPTGGYSDIKEGLIPSLLQAGGKIRPVVLDREVGNFRDRRGYLRAMSVLLGGRAWSDADDGPHAPAEVGLVRRGADTFVHPTARVCGPVVLADQAQIRAGAVVLGPAMIGSRTVLGENSVVARSALWAGARVDAGSEVCESIIDYDVAVPAGLAVTDRVWTAELSDAHGCWWKRWRAGGLTGPAGNRLSSGLSRLAERLPAWVPVSPEQLTYGLAAAALLLAFLWSYGPTFADLFTVWCRSDEYSSGLLVPFLTLYILWSRREELAALSLRPAVLWGSGMFLLVQAIRGTGLFLGYLSAERLSLILSLVALVLLLMGWPSLKKLATILVFLCLMLPWPNRAQAAVALPLQSWATTSAVFCLELIGYEVARDGNVIHIGDSSVAVAEACNGLRMVTAFFVISGLVVLLVRRAWWEKLVILVSSLPIALLCNTLRLAITAVMFTIVQGEIWEQRFHDWGGYAMMPLALAMVVGELWILARLTTPPTELEPLVISRRRA